MPQETNIGGEHRGFLTTAWTAVNNVGAEDSSIRKASLEHLIRAYWRPLYFLARHRGNTAEDAKDLVQSFFARLIEKDSLQLADRERGRFRTFLRAAFTNFQTNEWDRENARKRGGGQTILSIDFGDSENDKNSFEIPDNRTPEELFDRNWARTIFSRALDRLKDECIQAGKEYRYDLLKSTLDGEMRSMENLAGRFNLTIPVVKTELFRIRKRLRRHMEEEIAAQVSDPKMIAEEMQVLKTALS